MLLGSSIVFAHESSSYSSSKGKTQINCFSSESWRNTVSSAPDSGAVRITSVSCSSNLADATAYLKHDGGETKKSTSSTNRTVEAKVTLLTNVTHKHYYNAYYG